MNRRRITITSFIVLLLLFAGIMVDKQGRERRRLAAERAGFRELASFATEMIVKNDVDVVHTSEGNFIISYEAFWRYVQHSHPDVVASMYAQNPFPGVLPDGDYVWTGSNTNHGSALLFWSRTIHTTPTGPYQFGLMSDGRLHDLSGSHSDYLVGQ